MMGKLTAAAMALVLGATAGEAREPTVQDAEQLRKLDIMLMVTSLRCRNGQDDFQADYRAFSASHLATLNQAGRQLRAELQAEHGTKGAMRALDRLSVGMANEYGNGHPWLGCSELKEVAQELTASNDPAELVAAAGELLQDIPNGRLALARR
jgi:hypothetical protein